MTASRALGATNMSQNGKIIISRLPLDCIQYNQKLLPIVWDNPETRWSKDRRPANGTGRHQKVQHYKRSGDPSEDPALLHTSTVTTTLEQAKQLGDRLVPATCNSF